VSHFAAIEAKVAAQLDRPLKQGSGRNEGGVQEQWGDEIRTKEDTTGIQTAMTGGTPVLASLDRRECPWLAGIPPARAFVGDGGHG
jgi:hypothetical protein